MKTVSSKRQKTDQDYELLSNLEFLGSLYSDSDLKIKVRGREVTADFDGQLCMPGELIEAMLVIAGAKMRRRDAFKAGLIVSEFCQFNYSGPRNINELMEKPGYRDIRAVRVQRNKIMRTRPIFRSWSVLAELEFLPELLNLEDVDAALEKAGQVIGLGDYRPKYGRFTVESV